MDESEKLRPVGVRKVKDKFGFHKVYVYEALEGFAYIMKARIKEQMNEQDAVYLVSGLEGTGKSMVTLWAAEIYSEQKGEQIPIQNITRHLNELFTRIYNLKKHPSFISLDEGAELDGNKAATKEVKDVKDKFTAMRKLAHIVFICFVNPLRITTYFREDRIRGLFFVKRKGEVWFYANSSDNPHLITIIDTWRKDHDAKTLKFLTKYAPDFILRGLPDYHGYLRKPYEDRKDDNIMNVMGKGISEEVEVESEYADYSEGAVILGIGNGAFKRMLDRGVFNITKIRNKRYVKKTDLIDWKTKGLGRVKSTKGIEEVIII